MTHSLRERAVVSYRIDIEWDEQSVEQLVCKNSVEAVHTKTEDVLDVVEMVKVFSNQLFQTTTIEVAEENHGRDRVSTAHECTSSGDLLSL